MSCAEFLPIVVEPELGTPWLKLGQLPIPLCVGAKDDSYREVCLSQTGRSCVFKSKFCEQ